MAKPGRAPGTAFECRGVRRPGPVAATAALAVLLLCTGASGWARPLPAHTPETVDRGEVSEVVDGDTVVLRSGAQVRLVGIQAPKLPLGRRGFRAWPLSAESKDALVRLVLGKPVTLKYGGRRIDRHNRLLAHLFTSDGQWVQGAMLRDGMARVYTFPDNRSRVAEMLAQERAARDGRRGIWRLRYYRILAPTEAGDHIGTFQLVEGTVLKAALVRGRGYLNFGSDWRKDFTVTMSARWIRRNWRDERAILAYEGKRIRVRGWLGSRNGPQIEATHPEQIEVLR